MSEHQLVMFEPLPYILAYIYKLFTYISEPTGATQCRDILVSTVSSNSVVASLPSTVAVSSNLLSNNNQESTGLGSESIAGIVFSILFLLCICGALFVVLLLIMCKIQKRRKPSDAACFQGSNLTSTKCGDFEEQRQHVSVHLQVRQV